MPEVYLRERYQDFDRMWMNTWRDVQKWERDSVSAVAQSTNLPLRRVFQMKTTSGQWERVYEFASRRFNQEKFLVIRWFESMDGQPPHNPVAPDGTELRKDVERQATDPICLTQWINPAIPPDWDDLDFFARQDLDQYRDFLDKYSPARGRVLG